MLPTLTDILGLEVVRRGRPRVLAAFQVGRRGPAWTS
jgi:hypothetical protein